MQQRAAVGELLGELVGRVEGQGQAGLRIHVDEQYPPPPVGELGAEIRGDRRLTHAALVVEDRHHGHGDDLTGAWITMPTVPSLARPSQAAIRPGRAG